MMVSRYQQRSLYEAISRAVIPDAADLGWEEWMRKVDGILEDEDLLEIVHQALRKRWRQSGTRGRRGTPAEVVLRMLVLKHLRNWSYQTLEREVRANLVYREFTRIGGEKVPDAKTMVRLGQVLGPETIHKIHRRVVELARQKKVVAGRRMRVDTTVVESNVHYPTDSTLLADGVRVLTRTVGKVIGQMGRGNQRWRNRMRSVSRRVLEIGLASRQVTEQARERRQRIYRKLMGATRRVIRDSEQIAQDAIARIKKVQGKRRQRVKQWVTQVRQIIELAERVLKQTKARVIQGDTHYPDKVLSIFEVQTEAIRKGKTAKPAEFGNLVKIQEAENQIITDYEVYRQRPADQALLTPSIERHKEIFKRAPKLVAADAGFYSLDNESKATQAGVEKVAIPNRKTRSPDRRDHQRQRWFRQAQRWRVGCEGRISVLKRRHGLFRSRYKGISGMERWVGFGVVADNLINIGRAEAAR